MPISHDDSRNEFTLRGGSLRKIGKNILTRVPALASTSMLALGTLLCFDTASRAGECVETNTPAHYVCSGALDSESDVTQRQEAGSGEQLIVTQTSPFGVFVDDGNALELYGSSGSTGIQADFEATLQTAGEDGKSGIFVEHHGSGDVRLTNSKGDIRAQGDGIRVEHNGTGALAVTLADAATITSAKGSGIYAKTTNTEDGASGGVDISASGDIGTEDVPIGSHGIFLKHEGRGDADVTLSQNMNLFTQGRGISIETGEQTDDVDLRTDANIHSVGEGIRIHHQGTGDVRLDVAGEVLASVDVNTTEGSINLHTSRNSGGVDFNISGNVYSTGNAVIVNPEGTGDVSVRVAEGSVVYAQHLRAIIVQNYNADAEGDFDVHVAGSIGTRTHYTGHDGVALFMAGKGDISATLAASGRIFSERQGIDIEAVGDTREITVRAYGDIVSKQNSGIVAAHAGTGPLNITSGNITASTYGIRAMGESESKSLLNEINIRTNGNITSERNAILALQYGAAGLNITTASGTTLASREREVIAARAYEHNTGDMNITIGGDVIATGATPADAIRAYSAGEGDINITVAHGANVQGRHGIIATRDQVFGPDAPAPENTPRGTVHVDVGGRVQGETTAINMDAGITHRLTLRPGSQIIGNITSTGAANSFLVLDDGINSEGIGTFSFDGISGFNRLNKNGTQNWRLVGGMDDDQAFTFVTHNEGNMFIDDFALLTAPENHDDISVLIEPDASLFVRGDNGRIEGNVRNNGGLVLSQTGSIGGNLSNIGTLEVRGNNHIDGDLIGAGTVTFQRGNEDANLAVAGDFERGGTVVLNFSPTDGQINTLDIQGELIGTESTRVEIHMFGDVPSELADTIPVITAPTPPPFIDEFSGDEINEIDSGFTIQYEDSFTSDRLVAGAFSFDFEYDAALDGWALQQVGFSPRVPVFNNYPATLVQLARLSSMQSRLGSRAWLADENGGVWVRSEGVHTNIEPSNAAVKSSYKILDRRIRFGLDVPLDSDALYGLGRGLRFGANATFGSADTDVAAAGNSENDGSIGTDLFTFALGAQWVPPEGFYADAQAQYAVFSSDIASQQESMILKNDANAFNLSGELGYRFEMLGLHFVPQAQIEWSKVRFDGFVAPSNEIVSIKDGNVLDGRVGLTFDKQWSFGMQNRASFSAGAHLRVPFDGKTAVNVSGVPLVSEREDVALNLNAGFDYRWDNNTFTASLATSQGSEIEDYLASLSMHFNF